MRTVLFGAKVKIWEGSDYSGVVMVVEGEEEGFIGVPVREVRCSQDIAYKVQQACKNGPVVAECKLGTKYFGRSESTIIKEFKLEVGGKVEFTNSGVK